MSDAGNAEEPVNEPITAVSLAEIEAATARIAPHVWRTPLAPSPALSQATGANISLKLENLQRTHSFKPRGAVNAVLQLPEETRALGVATFSAGNHGQALAYAAQRSGIACTVFMAKTAVPVKVAAIRSFGAEIHFGETMHQAVAAMERFCGDRGARVISPFAEPEIIAGQGTVGLEILADAPDVEQIVVPIGGGGLIAGIALAVKSLKPGVRIVGVEPVGAPTVWNSLRAGKASPLDATSTIADGLAAPFTSPLPYAIIQRWVDDVVLVTDDEICAALVTILNRTKLLVEPAGAAGVAALLTNKAAIPTGANTVVVLSGGNVDLDRVKGWL